MALRVNRDPRVLAPENALFDFFARRGGEMTHVRLPRTIAADRILLADAQGAFVAATGVRLVERIPEQYLVRNRLRESGRLSAAELEAFAAALRELPRFGLALLDAHPGNLALVPRTDGPGFVLVVVDPGALVIAKSVPDAELLQRSMYGPDEVVLDPRRTGVDRARWEDFMDQIHRLNLERENPMLPEGVREQGVDAVQRAMKKVLADIDKQRDDLHSDMRRAIRGTLLSRLDYDAMQLTPNDTDAIQFRVDGLSWHPDLRRLMTAPNPDAEALILEQLRVAESPGKPIEPPADPGASLLEQLLDARLPLDRALESRQPSSVEMERLLDRMDRLDGEAALQAEVDQARRQSPQAGGDASAKTWLDARPEFASEVRASLLRQIRSAANAGQSGPRALVRDLEDGGLQIVFDAGISGLSRVDPDSGNGPRVLRINPFQRIPATGGGEKTTLRSLAELAATALDEYVRMAGHGSVRGWQEGREIARIIDAEAGPREQALLAAHPAVANDPAWSDYRFQPAPALVNSLTSPALMARYVEHRVRFSDPVTSLAERRSAIPLVSTPQVGPSQPMPTPGWENPEPLLTSDDTGKPGFAEQLGPAIEAEPVLADVTGDGWNDRVLRTADGIVLEVWNPVENRFERETSRLAPPEIASRSPAYAVFVARFAPGIPAGIVARLAEGVRAWRYDMTARNWVAMPGLVPWRDADGYRDVGRQWMADVNGDGFVDLLGMNCCAVVAYSYDVDAGQWRALPGGFELSASGPILVGDVTGDGRAEVVYPNVHSVLAWTYDVSAGTWFLLPDAIAIPWDRPDRYQDVEIREGMFRARGPDGWLAARFDPRSGRWFYPLADSDPASHLDVPFVQYAWSCGSASGRWILTQIDAWRHPSARVVRQNRSLWESEVACAQPAPGLPAFLGHAPRTARRVIGELVGLGWDRLDRYRDLEVAGGRVRAWGEFGQLHAERNEPSGPWTFPLAASQGPADAARVFVRYEWAPVGQRWHLVQRDTWVTADGRTDARITTLLATDHSSLGMAPRIPDALSRYDAPAADVLAGVVVARVGETPRLPAEGGLRLDSATGPRRVMADVTGDGIAERVEWDERGVTVAEYRASQDAYVALPGMLPFDPEVREPVFLANLLPGRRAAVVTRHLEGLRAWRYDAGRGDWSALPRSAPLEIFTSPGTRYPAFAADVTGDGVAEIVNRSRYGLDVHAYDDARARWVMLPGRLESMSDAQRFEEPLLHQSIRVGDVTGDGKADVVYTDGTTLTVLEYDPVRGVWTPLPGTIPRPAGWNDFGNWYAKYRVEGGLIRAEGEEGYLFARFDAPNRRWEFPLALSESPTASAFPFVSYRWACIGGLWKLLQRDTWVNWESSFGGWNRRPVESLFSESIVPCGEVAPEAPPVSRTLAEAMALADGALAGGPSTGPEPAPRIEVRRGAAGVVIQWEDAMDQFVLETAPGLRGPWTAWTGNVARDSWILRSTLDAAGGSVRFYRLRK